MTLPSPIPLRLPASFACRWRHGAAACAAAVLLAACGGGGEAGPGPGPGPGPIALTIQSSSPADGATGVARNVQPQLTLSAAVDTGTVTLSNTLGAVAAGVSAQGTQVTVSPTQRLLPATAYTVQVGNGPAVSFTTADGAWSATPRVLDRGTTDAQDARIAVNAQGNATAVWWQWDGTQRNIWASRYERATGWTEPFWLEHDAALADSPEVAMDAAGNAIAIWIQVHVSAPSLWASRFTPATGWESPQLLETWNGSAASNPRIAMNASGHAVVTWVQYETPSNIYATRYVPGTGWQGAQLVETHAERAIEPRVTVTPAGTAVVAWLQGNATGRFDAVAASAGTDGVWSASTPLATGDAGNVDLASAADGSVTAAWNQVDGQFQCWASRFQPATGWAPAQRLDSSPSPCHDPRVAVDARGGAIVVWSQDFGNVPHVWASVRASAGTWGAAERLSSGTEALDPAVAMDAVGNALVLWMQEDAAGDYPAHASRRLAGGTWSAPSLLASAGTSVQGRPLIAMDASGSAVALWVQWDSVTDMNRAVASHFD